MVKNHKAYETALIFIVIIAVFLMVGFTKQPDLEGIQNYEIQSKEEDNQFNPISLVLRVIFFLIVFAAVAFLAYITSRFYGKKAASLMTSNSGFLKVVDTIALGNNKGLILVKLGNEVLLLGVGEKEVKLIHKIEDTNGEFDVDGDFISQTPSGFKNYFDNLKKVLRKSSNNEEEIDMQNTSINIKDLDELTKGYSLGEDSDENKHQY